MLNERGNLATTIVGNSVYAIDGYNLFEDFSSIENYDLSTLAEPVPEPATVLLLGSGLICLAGFRRKFKK